METKKKSGKKSRIAEHNPLSWSGTITFRVLIDQDRQSRVAHGVTICLYLFTTLT